MLTLLSTLGFTLPVNTRTKKRPLILNPLDILLHNGFYRHHPFVRASDRVIGCCGIVKADLIADHNLLHYSTH